MRTLLILLAFLATPALAVEPGEMLDDPVLEERARDLSKGLRCPVCQNESIDESSAELARDLRILLRERLEAGDSDAEAVGFIVDRYGEFVLLRPNAQGANLVLWLAAPVLLLLALAIGWTTIRGRAAAAGPETLSDDEKARLDEILKS